MKRGLIIGMVVGASFSPSPSSAVAEVTSTFRAEGEIDFTFYSPQGVVTTNQHSFFRFVSSSGTWHLVAGYSPDQSGGDSWAVWSDGEIVISSFRARVLYVHTGKELRQVANSNVLESLSVHPGCFPRYDYLVSVPWLALGSRACLDEDTPAVWASPESEPFAHALKTQVQSHESVPYLPTRIQFLTSKERGRVAGKSSYLRLQGLSAAERNERKYPITHPDGLLAAEYRALDWTQRNGLALPLHFDLRTYYAPVDVSAKSTNALIALHAKGKVLKVSAPDQEVGLPVWKNVGVVDFRFRDERRRIDNIIYTVTNGPIPEFSSSSLQELFARKKAKAPYFYPDEYRAFVVWTVVGVLLLLPLVLLYLHRRKTASHRIEP